MAATLDRLSDGRLLINVVTGGDPVELKGDGVFLDARRALRGDATSSCTSGAACWRGETVDLRGQAPARRRARSCSSRRCSSPYPPLYFGGSSAAGIDVAAEHGRRLPDLGRAAGGVAEKIARVPRGGRAPRQDLLASASACTSSCARPSEEAWAAADELISRLDDETIARAQTALRAHGLRSARAAWRRCMAAGRDKLEVSPNLWAGVGLVRGGAGTALVGDPDQVADAHEGIHRRSASTASSSPAIRTSRKPIASPSSSSRSFPCAPPPATRAGTARNNGPFGEIIANDIVPSRRVAAH